MKSSHKKYLIPLLFIAIGGLLGYLYYFNIGCVTGTCRITSNPWLSTLYGALFGLCVSMLLPSKKQTIPTSNDSGNHLGIEGKED